MDLRSKIIWVFHYQKMEDPKKDRSFTMTTACTSASRDEKNGGKKTLN